MREELDVFGYDCGALHVNRYVIIVDPDPTKRRQCTVRLESVSVSIYERRGPRPLRDQ
jgi:hypothetical protein